MEFIDDHFCFACGPENKQGLCVSWAVQDQTTFTEFIPDKKFQGWQGIVHGGILATLLDEAMTRLAWIVCGTALTAELNVRFLRPAKIGEKIFVLGEIIEQNKKIVYMRASLHRNDSQGEIIAKSTGKAIKIKTQI